MKPNIERSTKILAKEISTEHEAVGLELLVYITTALADPKHDNEVVAKRCVEYINLRVHDPLDVSKMIEATLLAFPDEVIKVLEKAELLMMVIANERTRDPFAQGVVLGLMKACMWWDIESPSTITWSLAAFLVTVYHRTMIGYQPLTKEVSGQLSNLSSRFIDLFGPITQENFFKRILDAEDDFKDDHFVSQIIAELTLKTFLLQSVKTRAQIMAEYFAKTSE